MKRILVTGGAGFIGSHLVDRLIALGHQVIAFDNLATGDAAFVNPKAEFVKGDVRSPAELESVFKTGIDAVFHLAGQASIRVSFQDPALDLSVNTVGTINVLQQCIAHAVPRLLFASSMTIYGKTDATPTSESAAPNPTSYYGITKYAAERYVHLTAQRSDLAHPLNVTSFRMFNVYGERQSLTNAYQGVFAIFIGNILRKEPITIHSDGEQSRDFIHISDVVNAWVSALDNPVTYGEVFNLGTGDALSINQLCDITLSAFGESRSSYTVQYKPAQQGDMRISKADIRKMSQFTDWKPSTSTQDGMQNTIHWAIQRINQIKT